MVFPAALLTRSSLARSLFVPFPSFFTLVLCSYLACTTLNCPFLVTRSYVTSSSTLNSRVPISTKLTNKFVTTLSCHGTIHSMKYFYLKTFALFLPSPRYIHNRLHWKLAWRQHPLCLTLPALWRHLHIGRLTITLNTLKWKCFISHFFLQLKDQTRGFKLN